MAHREVNRIKIQEMTHPTHFAAIANFLRNHQYLHQQEILKRYPTPLAAPYTAWVDEMKDWSVKEIAQFETKFQWSNIKNTDFQNYMQTIETLCHIPHTTTQANKLHSNLKRGMTPKKIHEIQYISQLFEEKIDSSHIIDIGGGKGHLSAALTYQKARQSTCIDMNQQLQIQGIKRLQKWLSDSLSKIQFTHQKIDTTHPIPSSKNPTNTTLIGLHSCGNLSSQIITQGVKNGLGHIVNFGCCYHHIQGDYNLSEQGKQQNLWFSHEALHLAAHAHRIIDTAVIHKRNMVKRYRYALHFYLTDHFQTNFQKVGDGKTTDYQGTFAAYAKKFVPQLLSDIPDDLLESYFYKEKTQRAIQTVLLADSLRNVLGRLIELYIVLDRSLFLEEKGYKVTLDTYFNREISPRNLGIIAIKNA